VILPEVPDALDFALTRVVRWAAVTAGLVSQEA
jgi:hypothetical protein